MGGNRQLRIAGMPVAAMAFLLLTALASSLISQYKLTGGDDLLELWCDRIPTFDQFLHIQRTAPLVIDPFLYHGIMFTVIRLFGLRPHILEIPSLAGFLAMQVCLFYFVRRIASENAAVFAIGIPAISAAFGYSTQIRPYGVLLGLFGLAMLSWQTAARRLTRRTGPLVILALSIAAAINTQYYGVLLMLPLCAAEGFRTLQRRRLDVPLLLSMCAGMAGIALLLPFLRGAVEFRNHYKPGDVPYQAITQTYNFMLLGRATFTVALNHLLAGGLAILIVPVLWSCVRQLRKQTLPLPGAEFAFLITLAALPLFGFLLGRFVTHAYEPRYVLGATLGIAALLSVALDPLFQLANGLAGRVAVVFLLVLFSGLGFLDMCAEQRNSQYVRSYLVLSPEIKQAIMAAPGRALYTQDIDLLGLVAFHEIDPDLLSHLVLVYSEHEEMRWNQSETSSRMAMNLKSFSPYTIVPFESIVGQPGAHLFVVTHGGWNWLDKALAREHMEVKPIGQALGGEVVSARVP